MWQDIRYGFRQLIHSPSTAIFAIVSLALGIGATTVIFSAVYGLVLDPFPYKDPSTLMSIRLYDLKTNRFSYIGAPEQFVEIASRNNIFSSTIASTISDVIWVRPAEDGVKEPIRLRGNRCSYATFETMGAKPLFGRLPTAAEEKPGTEPVAVLSARAWKTYFNSDPAIIGRRLILDGVSTTIVGVAEPRFMFRGPDVYLPGIFARGIVPPGVNNVAITGRLKPGVTAAQADAGLRPIIEEFRKIAPKSIPENYRIELADFYKSFPSPLTGAIWMLLGAVCLLLLIACANVSSLLLSRALARRKEIAVRSSLGASRPRLIRQLLTESFLISFFGSALGIALAYGGLAALLKAMPAEVIPDEAQIGINGPVLLFSVGLSFLCALLFGTAPALQGTRTEVIDPLKDAARSVGSAKSTGKMRMALVVSEVALSLLLLSGAAAMLRSVLKLQSLPLGIDPGNIMTLRTPLPPNRYKTNEDYRLFFEQALPAIEAGPGILGAAVSVGFHPFGDFSTAVAVTGLPEPQEQKRIYVHQISAGYWKVFGIPLVRGRYFSALDVTQKRPYAVVTEAFVQTQMGGVDPIGRTIRIPAIKDRPFLAPIDSFEIIGVAKGAMTGELGIENTFREEVYLPYSISGSTRILLVKTAGKPELSLPVIRRAILSVDANQPTSQERTLEYLLDTFRYSTPRFIFILFAIFGSIGLTLAALGVYGVLSATVQSRTSELGVRLALGARPGQVLGMILRYGLLLISIGIAAGSLIAFGLARMLRGEQFFSPTFDLWTFAVAPLILMAAGIGASLIPAWRAARLSPMAALRQD